MTERLGWGWDGRSRRHSDQLRWEVSGVPEALMAEFSQRSVAIEDRNDLPLLCASDLADEILMDAASAAVQSVAERRATFSRANLLAEVHRQLHGVRFVTPDERIAVAERTAALATSQSLLVSAPELHHTPERFRRIDGTSRFRAKGHEVYTTQTLLDAEARLLDTARQTAGPRIGAGTVAAVAEANLPGKDHALSLDQAVAVEQIATSGRRLDVLVGPAGTGLFDVVPSCRDNRASPRRWPGCERHGRPSTDQARCLGWPRPLPPPRSWRPSWGSTPRTPPSGSTSTAESPNGWVGSRTSETCSPRRRSAQRAGRRCAGRLPPTKPRPPDGGSGRASWWS